MTLQASSIAYIVERCCHGDTPEVSLGGQQAPNRLYASQKSIGNKPTRNGVYPNYLALQQHRTQVRIPVEEITAAQPHKNNEDPWHAYIKRRGLFHSVVPGRNNPLPDRERGLSQGYIQRKKKRSHSPRSRWEVSVPRSLLR